MKNNKCCCSKILMSEYNKSGNNHLKSQDFFKKSRLNGGFTLVELIVVITILAILGVIAFISFQNYTTDARNGVRIADISSIKKNLELFITEKGFYPLPDNGKQITYKGGLARTQGTLGDNAVTNLSRLSKKPIDPLIDNEYTYSVANNKVEYQIGSIYEGGGLLSENNQPNFSSLISKVNAATEKRALAMIKGTYNEKLLKVSTGGIDYILAVPSIINTKLNEGDLQDIINNKELVYNNYGNLPSSYNNLGYTMTGGFEFVPGGDIVVYSGATGISLENDSDKIIFLNNLKGVYNGTILQGEGVYTEIINADTTTSIALVDAYIINNVGGITGKVSSTTATTTETYSCTGTLVTANANITNTGGLLVDTQYQKINPANSCYYNCNVGFTGSTCATTCNYTFVKSTPGSTGTYPYEITVDPFGNIYTPNYGTYNVTKITPSGVVSTLSPASISPYGITSDSVGNIYVTNRYYKNITKITPSGVVSTYGTTGGFPKGIISDLSGNVYTANYDSGTVSKITPSGVSTILGTTGINPIGITIDKVGNIYTSNWTSYTVTKITPSGVSTTLGTTTGSHPYGITIDLSGNIYTANQGSMNVTKITPSGVSSTLGTTGNMPFGITVDSIGNIYTANWGDDTVTKITPSGTSTILGTTGDRPQGITIDGSGNIYVANYGPGSVTKFTRSSCY
ncbi:MAG: SBBP repeat-containing protein [Candidatus Gracilibacteria bacterium]